MPKEPVYEMVGKRFGKQIVLRRATGERKGRVAWECRCDCGKIRAVDGYDLRTGHSTQCKRCAARAQPSFGPILWRLLHNAKARAKRDGLPCNISLADIVVPELCPLLGIPLCPGNGKVLPGSPTLDRLVPELGYIKGNILVISFRANTIKQNATPEELYRLAKNLTRIMRKKGKIQ